MSRRKQEKPQPRKNLIKGEADLVPDILTCGVCQKHFPLAEIVRFIQHKVQLCNKENNCLGPLLYEDSEEDTHPANLVLAKKEPQEETTTTTKCPPIKEEQVSSSSIIKMALSAKDATVNTNENSHEPRNYVCSTCKQSLSTAWALIQHAQNVHGLSICMDSSPDDKSEKPPFEASPVLSPYGLRAPLLERQMEPLFMRNSSQELRLDLIGKSSNCIANGPVACITPPPLLEPPKISNLQDSSYSQRLRVLAGATSPNAASTPRKLLQPNFKAMLNNNKTSPRPNSPPESSSPERVQSSTTHNSSASSTTSDLLPQTPSSSAKNRLCEYCGKSFQFKSNLIVHRRSHTGEKPFKCHICNHACTQASKLKRHMKTHRSSKKQGKSQKSSSEPANGDEDDHKPKDEEKQTNGDAEYCSDEKDEEEMEEEEIDVEEEEDEEEVNVDVIEDEDCLRENGGGNLVIDHPTTDDDMVAEDLTKKPLNNGTTENGTTASIKKEDNNKSDSSNDKKLIKHSVISEIMEKVGFGCIQTYNEAYKQALKESSYRNSLKLDRCSSGTDASNDAGSHHSYDMFTSFHHTERPPREGTRSAGQSPLSFGSGLLESFDQSINMKRIRLDDPTTKDKDRDGNFLYAGVWFPRVEPPQAPYRDLYALEATSNNSNHKSESALSGRPGPSSLAAKPKDSQTSRRNDTCEFCGKVFKNCSNLTVHRRSHTGEKPYKCELCSYACAQSSKLTRHMKTHGRLGKDVYRCRFCDMPFSVASTLEKHMRKCVVSQSGGSPYLVSEDSKEMTAA